ncbi:MAG: hypothetical protein K6G69_06835 [Lachnospiraceae bacterium]|nr:hypothetical protein [Lachnospiraceae bacterium]
MDTYKTENVVEQITAKIHPSDKNIPDCRCYLVLTERHLFVMEDNYDGSFEEHYVIDIKFIDDITMSTPSNPLATSGRLNRFRRPKKFLEVIYNDDNYVKQHLFFDEWDKLPKGLISGFQKIKNR